MVEQASTVRLRDEKQTVVLVERRLNEQVKKQKKSAARRLHFFYKREFDYLLTFTRTVLTAPSTLMLTMYIPLFKAEKSNCDV